MAEMTKRFVVATGYVDDVMRVNENRFAKVAG